MRRTGSQRQEQWQQRRQEQRQEQRQGQRRLPNQWHAPPFMMVLFAISPKRAEEYTQSASVQERDYE